MRTLVLAAALFICLTGSASAQCVPTDPTGGSSMCPSTVEGSPATPQLSLVSITQASPTLTGWATLWLVRQFQIVPVPAQRSALANPSALRPVKTHRRGHR
jgi:hypothetical protein